MGGVAAVDNVDGIRREISLGRGDVSLDHAVVTQEDVVAVIGTPGESITACTTDDHVSPKTRTGQGTVDHIVATVSLIVDEIFDLAGRKAIEIDGSPVEELKAGRATVPDDEVVAGIPGDRVANLVGVFVSIVVFRAADDQVGPLVSSDVVCVSTGRGNREDGVDINFITVSLNLSFVAKQDIVTATPND